MSEFRAIVSIFSKSLARFPSRGKCEVKRAKDSGFLSDLGEG